MDNRTEAIYLEGINSYKKKKYRVASSIFSRLSKTYPKNSIINFFCGTSFYMIKKYSLSILFFEKVITLKKNYEHTMQASIFLGHIFIEKKMYEKASEILQVPISEKYKSPYPYSLMGYIAHENKNYEEAEVYYKKCFTFSNENPNFNNNYGYNLLIWKGETSEAISYLQKSLEAKPNNPFYLHSLGWAMYKEKRYKDAAKLFEKALIYKKDEIIENHFDMAKKKLII